jgi:hypothetical protein
VRRVTDVFLLRTYALMVQTFVCCTCSCACDECAFWVYSKFLAGVKLGLSADYVTTYCSVMVIVVMAGGLALSLLSNRRVSRVHLHSCPCSCGTSLRHARTASPPR